MPESHCKPCYCDACAAERNAIAYARNHPNGDGPSPGYVLVDVNPNYFNCGHYPEWEVVEVEDGAEFETREAADALAAERNKLSARRWRTFLDS